MTMTFANQNPKDLQLQPLLILWKQFITACNINKSNNNNYNSGSDSNILHILNCTVQEIEQNVLVIVLLERAAAFVSKGFPEQGIEDLKRVMELAPNLMDSYLHTGNILWKAGKRYEARHIYMKGIKAMDAITSSEDNNSIDNSVNKQNWLMYRTIISSKNVLEKEIAHVNAMLLKLPLELLDYIFNDLLTFEDRYQSMLTCNSWQRFILDELPSIRRHHIMLGTMSKRGIARFLKTISQNEIFDTTQETTQPEQHRRKHKISILPSIANKSLQSTLVYLIQKTWHNRIRDLEVLSGLDSSNTFIKESIRMLLARNEDTLTSLTLCSYRDTKITVDAINKNPKLHHLISAAHHSLLKNNNTNDPPQFTFSGKKLWGSKEYATEIEYGRDVVLAYAQRLQLRSITRAHNSGVAAEEYLRRENSTQSQIYYPEKVHHGLQKLELVGMEMLYFLQPMFWSHLPNLEHVIIKNPVDLPSDFVTITELLHKHCPKLKTLRYGEGWESNDVLGFTDDIVTQTPDATASATPTSTTTNNAAAANAITTTTLEGRMDGTHNQQEKEKRPVKNNLVEFYVRKSFGSKIALNSNNLTIVSDFIKANSNTLSILVLHIKLLIMEPSSLDEFVAIPFPNLTELQLHRHMHEPQLRCITANNIGALATNCPILSRIVLNGVGMTTSGLLALKCMEQRLRFLHLKLNNRTTNNADRTPAFDGFQVTDDNDNNDTSTTSSTTSPLRLAIQNSMSMVTEVCFSGNRFKSEDLFTLTTCNSYNLTTIRLVACDSMTDISIIESALVQTRRLRHITFADMKILQDAMIAALIVELGYLEQLVIIKCSSIAFQNISEQVIDFQQRAAIIPRRMSSATLTFYLVPDLTIQRTHLMVFNTHGQYPELQLMTPTVHLREDISIVKPVLHFL